MSIRTVLCEGADDLNALRELALHVFGAEVERQTAVRGGGEDRKALLRAGKARIEIIVSTGGKSRLPLLAAKMLNDLASRGDTLTDAQVKRVAVVFDPDEATEASFHREVEQSIAKGAPAWTLTALQRAPGAWLARRASGERVQVRTIAWRALDPVVGGLADHQNLERLLCAVAARAYPKEAAIVERWLTEAAAVAGKAPRWKAALHLWCALVDEKASELNAATRFLHQNKDCEPHVGPALQQVKLFEELRPLLSRP